MKRDAGRRETDKVLSEMEKRISEEYRKASQEVALKLDNYLEKSYARDEQKRTQLANGEITRAEYEEWRKGQIMVGQRWKAMTENLAQDYHNANDIAKSIVNGYMPEVYAINHNYGTYEVEHGLSIDTNYAIYDRNTVEWMVKNEKDLIPPVGKKVSEAIAAGKDIKWNERQVNSAMLQSILQGESIDKMAKRLAEAVGEKNYKSAVRNARTMTTRAENYGRLDSYRRAEKMGIKMKKQWIATLDQVTRDSHVDLDGETVPVNAVFSNGMECPGGMGPPEEVYNCRCTMIAQLEGFEHDAADLSLRRSEGLGDMSYEEWSNKHTVDKNSFFGYKEGSRIKIVGKDNKTNRVTVTRESGVGFPNGAGGFENERDAVVFTTDNGTRVVYPADIDPTMQDLKPDDFLHEYCDIPKGYRDIIQQEVYIVDYENPRDEYWRQTYNDPNFVSYATGGEHMTFYAWTNHNLDYVGETIYHEGAHYIDKYSPISIKVSGSKAWEDAVWDDGAIGEKNFPNDYAREANTATGTYVEDFAVSVDKHFTDTENFKAEFPNRDRIIVEELKRNGWTDAY